jgi:hypothetical protein
MVLVFGPKFAHEDAVGFRAFSVSCLSLSYLLEALACVRANSIQLGCHSLTLATSLSLRLSLVASVNSIQTKGFHLGC